MTTNSAGKSAKASESAKISKSEMQKLRRAAYSEEKKEEIREKDRLRKQAKRKLEKIYSPAKDPSPRKRKSVKTKKVVMNESSAERNEPQSFSDSVDKSSDFCFNFPPDLKVLKVTTRKCEDMIAEALNDSNMQQSSCACCFRMFFSKELSSFPVSQVPCSVRTPLGEDMLLHFRDDASLNPDELITLCKQCAASLKKRELPKFCLQNNLDFGSSDILDSLTMFEEMLVSIHQLRIVILKLKWSRSHSAIEQKALRGNVISFPQNVANTVSKLPRCKENASGLVQIVFTGAVPNLKSLRNILGVSKQKVLAALRFLKQNNVLYENVDIDSESLESLPVDGSVPDYLLDQKVSFPDDQEFRRSHLDRNETVNNEAIPEESSLQPELLGMVDTNGLSARDEDIKTAAMDNLLFVSHESSPVNEFSDENFFLGAYPSLFPYGRGGPNSPRMKRLSFQAWSQYCLQRKCKKFRRHPTFMFAVYNTLKRWELSKFAKIRMKSSTFQKAIPSILSSQSKDMRELSIRIRKEEDLSGLREKFRKMDSELRYISGNVKGTDACKVFRRTEIFSQFVFMGLPFFWVTINPADMHAPIVCKFFGTDINVDDFISEKLPSAFERLKIVAQDPYACALYFQTVMKAFFEHYVRINAKEGGIFGYAKGYYGVMESQNRGSLHVHMMIWIHNTPPPDEFFVKMKTDEVFQEDVLNYLDEVLSEILPDFTGEKSFFEGFKESVSCFKPPKSDYPDYETIRMEHITRVIQSAGMHSKTHYPTCWKNGPYCRFRFPRSLVEYSFFDSETSQIHLRRNDSWVNSHQRSISFRLSCNNDAACMYTATDLKACVYYITNYTTKSELSAYEVAFLKSKALEDMESKQDILQNRSESDKARLILLRCLNMIGAHKEVPAQMVITDIMNWNQHFASHSFATLHWLSIFCHFQRYFKMNISDFDQNEEEYVLELDENKENLFLANLRIDYAFRGEDLKHLCLYDYVSLIHKVPKSMLPKRSTKDLRVFEFDKSHPQALSHVQRTMSTSKIPNLIGGNFPPTYEDENFALFALILFKPWKREEDLKEDCFESFDLAFKSFQEEGISHNSKWIYWLENILLIHECKDSAQSRRAEIVASRSQSSPQFDNGLSSSESSYEDLLAFFKVFALKHSDVGCNVTSFVQEAVESLADARRFVVSRGEQMHLDFQISQFSFDFRPKQWKKAMNEQAQFLIRSRRTAQNVPQVSNVFEPTEFIEWPLSRFPDTPSAIDANRGLVEDLRPQLAKRICERNRLNYKQSMAFLLFANHFVTGDSDPLLMFLSGEGGTGKSFVIKSIVEFLSETHSLSVLRLSATTGTASVAIGGSTIHTLASLMATKLDRGSNAHKHLTEEFHNVKYLIIDEVSILDCNLLHVLNQRLMQAVPEKSSTLFGGVSIIFCGDFYQLAPPKGTPLYANLEGRQLQIRDSSVPLGQQIWRQVSSVIILDENFRSQKDPEWMGILKRFRNGECTEEDYEKLRPQMLDDPSCEIDCSLKEWQSAPIIVTRNDLRESVTEEILKAIVAPGNQDLTTILSIDSTSGTVIEDSVFKGYLRNLATSSTEQLSSELKLFKGAPVVVLHNQATELGIANGTFGRYYGTVYPNGDRTLFPECVLIEVDSTLHPPLLDLPRNVVPIYPVSKSFDIQIPGQSLKTKITRRQIPISLAFSITDYKAQGSGFLNCILDLRKPPSGSWNKFFSVYTLLSRSQTLKGTAFLKTFPIDHIMQPLPEDLRKEIDRLKALQDQTISKFSSIYNSF